MERHSKQRRWRALFLRWFGNAESRFLNLVGIDPVALSYSRAVAEWRDGGPRPDAFFVADVDVGSSSNAERRMSQSMAVDRSGSADARIGEMFSSQPHA